MIRNIQLLRAVAAYLVVFHHIKYFSRDFYPISWTDIGGAGVHIFFVISGFIMVYIQADRETNSLEFMRNRIARVAPLYWLVTFSIISFTQFGLAPLGSHGWTFHDLLTSIFFIPNASGVEVIQPILFVGWSLNYEMFFYLCFSVSLICGELRKSIIAISVLFVFLYIYGQVTQPSGVMQFYTDSIMLEFMLGCLLGIAYIKIADKFWEQLLPLGAILAGLGVLSLVVSETVFQYQGQRIFIYGLPATMIVASALILERSGFVLGSRFAQLQGAASYAMYLIHPLLLQMLFKVAEKLFPAPNAFVAALVIVGALAAVCIVGTLMHLWVEKPISNIFARRPRLKSA